MSSSRTPSLAFDAKRGPRAVVGVVGDRRDERQAVGTTAQEDHDENARSRGAIPDDETQSDVIGSVPLKRRRREQQRERVRHATARISRSAVGRARPSRCARRPSSPPNALRSASGVEMRAVDPVRRRARRRSSSARAACRARTPRRRRSRRAWGTDTARGPCGAASRAAPGRRRSAHSSRAAPRRRSGTDASASFAGRSRTPASRTACAACSGYRPRDAMNAARDAVHGGAGRLVGDEATAQLGREVLRR